MRELSHCHRYDKKMNTYFITGIGTGVGKTYLTSHWLKFNRSIKAIKPIISGWQANEESDTTQILTAMNLPCTKTNINAISPWRYHAPLSPDMAARLEGQFVDFEKLIQFCNHKIKSALKNNTRLLIEGVGGPYVPINASYLVIDWMRALQIPVILVGSNYLGALNHTLSILNGFKANQIPVKAIIINEVHPNQIDIYETKYSLQQFTSIPIQTNLQHQVCGLDETIHLKAQ